MGCNSITLSALNSSCSNSVGGIQVVYLIPYDNIAQPTVAESGESKDMISVINYASSAYTDASWVQFKFRKNTGSMTSTFNLDETNGVSFIETELNMIFSKMETKKRLQMVALAQGEVACIVKDSNGLYWFLGFNEGVTTSAGTGQTGQQKTDGNYYSVTLKDSSEVYPYEVAKSVGEAIETAASKDEIA